MRTKEDENMQAYIAEQVSEILNERPRRKKAPAHRPKGPPPGQAENGPQRERAQRGAKRARLAGAPGRGGDAAARRLRRGWPAVCTEDGPPFAPGVARRLHRGRAAVCG